MTTHLFFDELFFEHKTPAGHPECPARARRAWERIRNGGLDKQCARMACKPADRDLLLTVHAKRQVEAAKEACEQGGGLLEADTSVSPRSFDAAILAVGSGIQAVDQVVAGKAANAFCLVRPPGHHATPTRSMGFCLFNNIAVAAKHAVERLKLDRVLIVDWDVHHGNGTQDIFYDDPRIMFFSAHRYPFYPGTGAADETGQGKGLGYTLNLPVAFGTERKDYRDRFRADLEQAAAKIKPELVLLSAGFDAHRLDPIGSLGLEIEDFAELGEMLIDVANMHAKGRLVSFLEGGYNLDILARCVEQHLRQLLAASKQRRKPGAEDGT